MQQQESTKGYIYNVTIKVDASIAAAWFQWLVQQHIPDMMATKCFENYRVVKLLEMEDAEGPTYAIQYQLASRADYNRYVELHASALQTRSFGRWGDRFIAFRTLMEIVH
ncbi:MAG: DUF4286 family protein [Flavisolibacter sp.]